LTPPLRSIAALILLASAALTSPVNAQQSALPRTVILLDPAHGGPDAGAHLPNSLLEKDFDLAFAAKLRTALASGGFTLISTRDSDPAAELTADQRAEIANHSHPAACLILHATSSGTGIHIVTSALTPPDDTPTRAIPWDNAQAASIPQSLSLANEIGLALTHATLPAVLSRASIHPLDNLTCPAVAIEIAPLGPVGSGPAPITSATYQQHVIQAIVSGLTSWRAHNPPATPPAGASR
jgi:N-acetylmuramoyl-L-alanine amidase